MQVMPRLVDIYRRNGYDIVTGISPRHANSWIADYTFLLKGKESCTNHLGITPHEIGFMECAVDAVQPKNILVIGNSYGWSTFALALSCPGARIVAMDIADEPFTLEWIDHTNRIAAEEGLSVRAVKGRSPDDVDAVVAAEFDGPLDFVFFDGDHNSDALVGDFNVVQPHAAAQCLYLFHDVLGFGLQDGIKRVLDQSGLTGRLIYGSPSGMMAIYDQALEDTLSLCFATYGASQQAIGVINMLRNTEVGRVG